MKKNECVTVTCTDLTDQGFGVAHVDGITVFVSDLLPEEEAKVRIIKVFKKYCIGKVEERLTTSPMRTQPRCPVAKQCGGCSFQHFSYAGQLEYKEKQLKKLFQDVNPEIRVLPIIGMEDPYYYRNKAQFPVQVKNEEIRMGFYRPKSNTIVDVPGCLIQSRQINAIYSWLRNHLPVSCAKELRHIFIRSSEKTEKAQVVFIGSSEQGLQKVADELVEAFPEIVSVVFNENKRNDNVILGEKYKVLFGSAYLPEQCPGLDIRLHFKSFFQVNPTQMEVLYEKALEAADLQENDRVIELYAGTGTIGMLASRKAKQVIGVEIVEEAVRDAQENLKLNQITNAQYICQDATAFAHENTGKADVLIVDPPRKGMSAQGIADIVQIRPNRIVYVSCNPRTLARDLVEFEKEGYFCKQVQPVDMFPQTTGVECVALLQEAGH